MDRESVTVKDFKTELFESNDALEARSKDSKGVKHTSVPFVYDDQEGLTLSLEGYF